MIHPNKSNLKTKSKKVVKSRTAKQPVAKAAKAAKATKSTKATKAAKSTKATKATKELKVVKASKSKTLVKEKSASLEEKTDAADSPELAKEVPVKLLATKESVVFHFEKLVLDVQNHIESLKANKVRGEPMKFTRKLLKNLKNLKSKTVRVVGKKKTTRRSNGNSGFLKPVAISSAMAKFTGWSQSELKSRVDVTKYICKYIKENDLQNPKDRRQILADSKLTKLLGIKKDDPPLTYYRIQSYMKPHFSTAKPN